MAPRIKIAACKSIIKLKARSITLTWLFCARLNFLVKVWLLALPKQYLVWLLQFYCFLF